MGADAAKFWYDPDYLDMPEPTPLSVRFPLREEVVDSPQVAYWLQNLLPDDKDVIEDWCGAFGADVSRPITPLGTAIGVECAGAVQFCTPDRTAELLDAPGGLEPDATVDRAGGQQASQVLKGCHGATVPHRRRGPDDRAAHAAGRPPPRAPRREGRTAPTPTTSRRRW